MASVMSIPVTEFAPAERVPLEIIRQQAASFNQLPFAPVLLNSSLNFILVLNAQRQIVFATRNFLSLPGFKDFDQILGQRPGEALGCLHSDTNPSGCGTSVFCQECGAVKSIVNGLAGRVDVQECRLTRHLSTGPQAMDLLVSSTPWQQNGENYVVVAVSDISNEKRRHALERTFFHDLVNTAGGLNGLMDFIKEEAPLTLKPDMDVVRQGLDDLLELVATQRELLAAEQEELAPSLRPALTRDMLEQVVRLFAHHDLACQRRLMVAPGAVNKPFTTDASLLKRVLGNLVKNALEAISPGEMVTLDCTAHEQNITFTVQNPGVMPREVQLQVFNRSFSTKGNGRGLGTYSVKMLTEKYLRGQASFVSGPATGTVFSVTYPRLMI